MKKIFVLGSINYDLVISSPYIPENGETLSGSGFFTNSGGKGANQAVACSKLGANAIMLGATGDDIFGKECKKALQSFGVNTDFIQEVENCNTGVAVIVISGGDNRIILEGGANHRFNKEKMYALMEENLKENDILVCQLEIPLECVSKAFDIAKRKGVTTVLNPAPAKKINNNILNNTDIIIPNQSEAEILSGIKTDTLEGVKKAYDYFIKTGIKEVIITLGSKGCYYDGRIFPAIKVEKVVDTTAAGDTFIGALVSQISKGKPIEESIDFCQKACALKITRKGAQIGIPTSEEVTEYYK